jgi:hypothetical protein
MKSSINHISRFLNHIAWSKQNILAFSILTIIWLILVRIVSIEGNFPLNDDWSYGQTAIQFHRTGVFRPSDFTAMPLITNVVLAYPFLHLFGETFISLRISSLFYHWLTSVLIYYVSLKRQNITVSIIATMTFLFSPIPFILSFTFMTESIFQLLCTALLAAYVLNRNDNVWLVTILSILATLSRQIVVPALMFPVVYYWQKTSSFKRILHWFTPISVSVTAYFVFRWWLVANNSLPALYSSSLSTLFEVITKGKVFTVAGNIQQALLMIGFLMFPILILKSTHLFHKKFIYRHVVCLAFMLFTVSAKALLMKSTILFPYTSNVLNSFGFGPMIFAYGSFVPWTLPEPVLITCSLISISGGSVVLALIYGYIKNAVLQRSITRRSRGYYFSAALLLPTIFVYPLFDRYIAVAVATIILTIVSTSKFESYKIRHIVTPIIILLFQFGFCLMAGTDYMNVNRLRHRVYEHLVRNVDANPHTIDAGFEYNGLNNYRYSYVPISGKHLWMDEVKFGIGFQVPRSSRKLYTSSTRIMFGTRTISVYGYEVPNRKN